MCCGRLDGPRQGFFPDASPDARLTVPVSCFLVRHPKGTLLFDTGVACGVVQDPIGVLGKLIASYFKMAGSPNENVVDQLATQGLVPDDITHVACSHLHFDHCGCNRHFPRAKILMQRAEMDAAREPGSPYSRRLWDLSLDYQFLEGEHDVFGDGNGHAVPDARPYRWDIRVRSCAPRWTAASCWRQTPVTPKST
jgi:glyoxylase-like metal-dependent hydrolase (beta-lactamase superfamily II)